jgi:hypothetical protein
MMYGISEEDKGIETHNSSLNMSTPILNRE